MPDDVDAAAALLDRLPLSEPIDKNIPDELKKLPNWVAYAAQERDGRVTKPPLDPKLNSPHFANVNKPQTWGSFRETMAFLSAQRGKDFKANGTLAVVAGVGLMLTAESGVTGIDIDHCTLPDGSIAAEWAKSLIEAMSHAGFYIERSPSGTGIRAFCREPLPSEYGGKGVKKNNVEVYTEGRFLTVTGHRRGGCGTLRTLPEGEDCKRALLLLWAHAHPEQSQPQTATPQTERPKPQKAMPKPTDYTDDELLQMAFQAKNGAVLESLFNTPLSENEDKSRVDLQLANRLAFWSMGDPARLDRMMRLSARLQPPERLAKWDQRHSSTGATYGEMTCAKALEGRTEFFGSKPFTVSISTGERKGQGLKQGAQPLQTAREPVRPPVQGLTASPAVVLASDMPSLDMLHPCIKATIADVAEVNSTGMEVAFASFLSFMGTIIAGRASVAMLEENAVYLNLYLVLEAQSGNAKSGAQKFFYGKPFALLRASETEYARAKEKYDKDMEAWSLLPESVRLTAKDEDKPKKPRKRKTDLIRGNFTLEGAVRRCASNPNGVGVVVDELAQLLGGLDAYSKGGQGQTKSFLLSAYEGDVYSNARKAEADELSAACCLISIFGACQPEKLAELYTLSDLFSGFLSRFIFISYEQKDAQILCSRRYNEESRQTVARLYSIVENGLIKTATNEKEGTPKPILIPIDDDARAVFLEWVNRQHRKEWDLGHYTGPVNKLSVQMTKIIGLIHIANVAAGNGTSLGSITKEEVLACLPLWDWLYGNFLSVMERLYAKASGRKGPLTLNGRDRDVLATVVRNVRLESGQSLTVTAKEIAAWLETDGKKVPTNAVAFAMKKLLAPGEIVLSSNPSRRPNQYKLTGATMARLQAASLKLDATD